MFVFDFVENHLVFEYVAAKANSSCGKLEMKVLSECQRCPRQELVSHRLKQLKATKPVFSVVRVYGGELAGYAVIIFCLVWGCTAAVGLFLQVIDDFVDPVNNDGYIRVIPTGMEFELC